MAGVGGHDRGQLLLAFAIGLAVAFVVLALILNTAVVAELHATQADHGLAAERDVAAYEFSVRAGVGGLLVSINAEGGESTAELVETLNRGIGEWDRGTGGYHAEEGTVTDTKIASVTPGTRIVHDNETRAFTNRDGLANWTVVDEPATVRDFRMNVTRDGLASDAGGCEFCFNVTMDDPGGSWSVLVARNAANEITVTDPASGATCAVGNATTEIDFTAGTLDGESCDVLAPAAAASTDLQRITYINGDRAMGAYELTVDLELSQDPHFSEEDSPRIEPVIYSVWVDLAYRSTDVVYETRVLVEPGDP